MTGQSRISLPKFNLSNSIISQIAPNFYNIAKKFKKELGIAIKEYINIIKVLDSLTYYNSNNTILKIAILSGYNSIEYYSEVFSKLIGVSPRTYKKFIKPLNNLSEEKNKHHKNLYT